jgi:peptidyl-tRNA hydrolase
MNNSGQAVRKNMDFYKVDLEDVMIVYDDLDMDFGKIRIKKKSSSGGHNGVKSIISHVNTDDFIGKFVELNIDDYATTYTNVDGSIENYKASSIKDVGVWTEQ